MKRCIICGNTGDDNSAVCSVCGNPYVDMSDSFEEDFEETGKEPEEPEEPALEEGSQPEEASKEPAQEEKSEEPAGQSAKRSPRPHGMTAGPHIYGQEDGPYSQGGAASAPEAEAGEPQEQPPLQQAEGQLVRRQTARKAAARGPQGEAPAQQPGAGRPAPARSMPQGNRRPYPGQPQGAYPQGRPQAYGSFRIRETARAALHSPMFFFMALLYTAFLAGSVAAIFMQELNYSQYARIVAAVDVPAQFVSYVDDLFRLVAMLDTDAVILNLVLKIPDLLFCLGLWMIFFLSGARKPEMSGTGFLLGKIAVIVRLIMACLALLLCLIVSVSFLVASWVSGAQITIVVSAVLLVLMITVTMMVIMYYAAYLGTIKVCRLNANGESYGSASGYLGVMSIFLALLSVVNLLSAIVNAEISGLVSSIGNIGWLALFAVWIFRYRGEMSEVED